MFAISYNDLEITENMDVGIARLILYSTFIHSILKGKYEQSSIETANEKWIMRKIADLKMISEDVYEEDLPEKLLTFVEEEQKDFINFQNIKLHTVLTSYFKLDEKSNGKHSVDFLHKSFQEYFLAEYYVESILYNRGYRLNIGHPSNVTVKFLDSLLSLINNHNKKEYEKYLLRIVRSFYLNKAGEKDEEIIKIAKTFKNYLLENAVKIFEENKIVYVDLEDKPKKEYWKEKEIPNYKKYYENFIYKAISLFIIKKLDPERNPSSLVDYIKDSYNISPTLRYFPFVNLSRANLSRANLSYAELFEANLIRADLSEANLNGVKLHLANLNGAKLEQTSMEQNFIKHISKEQISLKPLF